MQSSPSLILTLVKQARQTFANLLSTEEPKSNPSEQIESIKRLMNKITKYESRKEILKSFLNQMHLCFI
ncbi:unnamed protein product [Adineta ricciae]|uniref:Uncharacterized protein n=1 Tax=Adineta ricciae TaxID=249248 RepID=A0A815XR66_ADIRI|nr:unnamed protein product [Adineta ricciae]